MKVIFAEPTNSSLKVIFEEPTNSKSHLFTKRWNAQERHVLERNNASRRHTYSFWLQGSYTWTTLSPLTNASSTPKFFWPRCNYPDRENGIPHELIWDLGYWKGFFSLYSNQTQILRLFDPRRFEQRCIQCLLNIYRQKKQI